MQTNLHIILGTKEVMTRKRRRKKMENQKRHLVPK